MDDTDEITRAFSEGFDMGASMNEAYVAFSELWIRDGDITVSAKKLVAQSTPEQIAEKYLTLSMYYNMALKELQRLCIDNTKLRLSPGEDLVGNVIAEILLSKQNMEREAQ